MEIQNIPPQGEVKNSSVFKTRPPGEAYDELVRELQVRDRLYVTWVKTGKMNRTDARDRYDRLKTAILLFGEFVPGMPEHLAASNGQNAEGDDIPF